MNDPRERARRIVAHLRERTVARGCTPAEEAQAKERIAQLTAKYQLGAPKMATSSRSTPPPCDPFAQHRQAVYGTDRIVVLTFHFFTDLFTEANKVRSSKNPSEP